MADSRRHRNHHRGPSRVEAPKPAEPAHRDQAGRQLHVCPDCGSELVQPRQWEPVDIVSWRVELRCPECEREETAVFPQELLDRYDAVLDAGVAVLIEDLRRLEQANLEAEASRFLEALAEDRILPEDF